MTTIPPPEQAFVTAANDLDLAGLCSAFACLPEISGAQDVGIILGRTEDPEDQVRALRALTGLADTHGVTLRAWSLDDRLVPMEPGTEPTVDDFRSQGFVLAGEARDDAVVVMRRSPVAPA